MTDRQFTVTGRETLAHRLIAVDGTGHTVKGLYPRLLSLAGTSQNPVGIVLAITLHMADYLESMGLSESGYIAMERVTVARFPQWLRAMTDDDEAYRAIQDHLALVGLPDGRTS